MGDDHRKGHVYGAVAPLTGRTHYRIGRVVGKEALATCVWPLLRSYDNKQLLVIHDRAAQHKGQAIETRVHEAAGRLVLKPQPTYSRDLNPEERMWKWMRRVVTPNHWFDTLAEDIQSICHLN